MKPSEIYDRCLVEHELINLQLTSDPNPLGSQHLCIDPIAVTQHQAVRIIEEYGKGCDWARVQPDLRYSPVYCPVEVAEKLYFNLEDMFDFFSKVGTH